MVTCYVHLTAKPRFNTRAFVFSALHQRYNQHVNDITTDIINFTDDTNVFVSHKDKDCLTNILNAELNKLSLWFGANRLSLNLEKTKFIVFKPCQKCTNQTIQLLINSQKIDQVKLGTVLEI